MTPNWLPKKWHRKFNKPWEVKPGRVYDLRFKRALKRHGYLSPNFRATEFASKSDGCGCPATPIPKRLQARTQKLCFMLEDARHRMGDVPIGVLSGYRTSCHNNCVGGAGASEHMAARAIDPIPHIGIVTFNRVMESVFHNHGIGVGCNTGKVMHVDTGPNRRWCYPGN